MLLFHLLLVSKKPIIIFRLGSHDRKSVKSVCKTTKYMGKVLVFKYGTVVILLLAMHKKIEGLCGKLQPPMYV